MKLLSISFGLLVVLLSFAVGIDMLMGYKLQKAINNVIIPFSVMDPIEIITLSFFIILLLIQSLNTKRQKK
ncbi:hypothetical protein MXL46_17095 [Heyndrickxia sporothermodurans]|uniref:hypothetical protein n=1 Tax=Heyndrickxia sporothermodurans TaxID=46224 RepID=UPI002DBF3FE7|nr:hypothetical protein [Heyndrickxia sporothermodurans]MEB6550783.1 hypothetical protein [Heyndrickxia sporothermodurans]